MKQKWINLLLLLAVVLIAGIIVADYLSTRPGRRPPNPYAFDVSEYELVDKSLVSYREVRQIRVADAVPVHLAARGKELYLLTAGTLQEPGMLPWIVERLKERRIPAECVVFEMKEATVVNHLKSAKEFVKGLKNLHCRFALDDFGAGLNPFQLLQHIPADYLKIDRSFMEKLTSNEENQETIRQLTDGAHGMNKLVIAQHVEDATGLSILWGIGVNYIQGNFLQAPSTKLDYDFTSMS
jgi:hypothetical protein